MSLGIALRLRVARAMTGGMASPAERALLRGSLQEGARTAEDLPAAARAALERLEARAAAAA